jgi:RNA polymerase sigma-70 factor (ECF subfamily)
MLGEARFDAVYVKYGASILRYCVYSAGSAHDGEDITAEVFARLLVKGEHVPDERAEAWLFTVARNLCVSHHRNAARRGTLERRLAAAALVDAASNGIDESGAAWGDPAIWDCLRCLDEKAGQVVYLRVVEDRPFAEIARLVGKREGATKMMFYRALERLRRDMERDSVRANAGLAGGVEDV